MLTPIIMATSMLKEDPTDADAPDMIRTIEESASHGAALVRQALAFARGVDGARVAIDLGRVVQDVGRIVKETFAKNIELRTNVTEDPWPLRGDPTQVHQVLLNLCVNARDAMPNGGTITISAENVEIDETYAALSAGASPGPHVRIVVEDTGTGIPRDSVDQIFDPCFGGYVSVYSEPGRGSSSYIYLPSSAAEDPVPTITRLTLTTYGYRVLTAIDGADALATYARRGDEIDLVLTDMRMPVMDGPATVPELRRVDPAVRIIAASGLDAGSAERVRTKAGFGAFWKSPTLPRVFSRWFTRC